MGADKDVRSVWADNFKAESIIFSEVAPHAIHVTLNVQYPGCVVRGDGQKRHYEMTAEQRYQVVRANVTRLKPLQVGLAVRTGDGGTCGSSTCAGLTSTRPTTRGTQTPSPTSSAAGSTSAGFPSPA